MKKTHTLHRLLSLALCICMVLSMVPGYALPALAEEAEPTCTCTVKCGETADTNCAVCSAAGADLTAVCIAEPVDVDSDSPYSVVDTEAGTLTIDGTLGGKAEATDEDITALTNTIKSCVDSGITTVIVTGSELAIYNGFYDNYPAYAEVLYYVTEEDDNSKYCGTIDLILPDVTEIGEYEFNVAFSLKSVTLPKVTTIGDAAFWECMYLQTLTFGSVVTSIGSKVAFADVGVVVDGGTDLVLNCGQMLTEGNYKPNLETNEWGYNSSWEEVYKWNSITLSHTPEADDGDCTTAVLCSACGEIAVEAKESHTGGTATCTEKAVCDLCGTWYGELDPNNHAGTLGTPVPTEDDTQHTATWFCCEATVTEEHTFDETGKCGDCNAHAVASLTAGETVTYYTTADGVFAAAKNSTGSATITILADARTTDYVILHDREDLALVVEEGAVLTLGYILYFRDPISGGGTIAGEGNGEILLYDGGTIDGVTVSTSILNLGGAIIGGTFSQNVEMERGQITGGTFNGTVTNEGGQITGGIFHGAVINDIRYADLEQPSISGGIFNNSVSNKGGLITGGTFNAQLTNTAGLTHDPGVGDVEVCGKIINTADPTTFTLGEAFVIENRDGTIDCASHIWKDGICRLCGKPCTHIGGEATCTEKAVCDRCGISYGEPAGHSFDSTTGKCTKCEAYIAVATLQVGESVTYYATADDVFTAAIAAQDGTVTILADTTAATPFYDVCADLIVLEGATLTVEKDLLIRGADVSGEGSIDVDENGRFLLEQGGTIDGVTVNGPFYNGNLYRDTIPAVIKGGTFTGKVDNSGCIQGGTFLGTVTNCADVMVHGTIEDGTFNGEVFNDGSIQGGIFNAAVTNWEHGVITNTETPTTFTLGEHFSITNEGNVHCTFHIWKDGVCRLCEYECTHKGSTHTSVTDLGDGNHSFICTVCGKEVIGHIADETVDQTCRGYFCTVCENWFGEADTTNHHSSIQYDNNGFCPNGCYEEAVWNEEDGVYEISNAGQLYWYAQYLNTTNAEIFAELTADIIIPENAPNWEPINASYAYFNGNFHTISGLKCIGGDAQYVGLFGMEGWWYEISNLHIDGSYFEGSGYVGAVVACMTNGGSITNCAVTNTTVQGDGDSVGTLAGYLSVGSVVNCFVDTNTLVGGYTDGYVTIENSYYLSETETEDGGKTAEQFASGEVAYLLQSGIAEEDIYDEDWNWIGSEQPHVWGQTVGQDAYPVLKGQKVYENLDCAGAVAGYANEIIIPEHSFVQGYCRVCGEPLGDAVLDGVTYVFGGVIPLRWYPNHVEVPTYWVAGDGYVYFDPAAKLLTLDNATVYSELWSSEEAAVYWEDDLVINFSGTNTMSANDHSNGIVISVKGAAVMNGIGQNAVLNIISGADQAALFEGGLTVNSGTVSFVSKDSDHSSVGVSTVALTVAEGAVVNVTAGNANYENGLSYGMAAEKLHVDGTLNASYGFCVNERQPWSCGVICTELTGSGTINALMLQLDQENMILNFTACGKAVLASNWKAMTEEEVTITNTFTVAEGAILTIPEGVTLDLTGLPAENISIRGTILNNGTIICNHSVAEDDGDCTTDIPCLICHQPVIAGNDEHDWMDATCTTAKVCSFCGTTEGDALGHGTIEGFEYHQYSDYHEVWCTDCWAYSYQENHTYGEDHYCICGAPEMFTVTFMNGDEVWITDNRYYNTKIAYVGMNYPTKEGHSFSGWYTAEGDPIANGTLVMGDMVVYAGFRINTYNYTVEVYTMDLFGNYGEPVVTTEAAAFGSIVDLTGYQTGEHFYLDGENINSKLYATVPANDDLVMRVYVVRKSYDITWILNGCTVVTEIVSDLPTSLRYSGDLGEYGWHYVNMLLDTPAGYRVVDYVDGNGNSIAKESYNGHDRLKFPVTGDMTIEVVLEKETVDDPVKLETAALSFKEKIHYNIFFSLNLAETVELADMGLILFDSLNADGTVDDAIATYSGAVQMDGKYMVATDGIHAKRMGDTIYFRVYAKLADGSYVYSKTVEYSAVTYAQHILKGDYSDSDKALVVAMLNYGAQAQRYFGYNTENPVNAGLTEEQQALVKGYESDLLAPVQKPDSSKTGAFASTGSGFAKKAPAVSFEGSFVLNYFFTPSATVAGDMTLYYWTEADYAAATELTAENATGSIVMTPGAQYHAVLDGIYAKDVDATVYVAAVYSDGTATHCTGVLPYSIGAYLTSHAARETNFQAMAQAAAVYCSYCKEYFKG